ncbi:MAG: T9SS type A sorting domain-containing protein [Bacteroidia bacterium]|nr:T9SS type A sorting domain-containing protein [Bacteroidia bacterium]
MKTFLTIILGFLCIYLYAYNWTLYGPSGVHANNILFGAGSHSYSVICTNTGICVNDCPCGGWNTYTLGLPVWEAAPHDTSHILLVAGNGSYSDGIYNFDIISHTFNIIQYCYIPTLIRLCTVNNLYYAGTRYNSLLYSTDGITWDTVPYFSDKACAALDYYEQHLVAIQENNLFATYFSSDSGQSWAQSLSNILLHDIAFHPSGLLYGVFTGFSNSSGLYLSADYGETWNIVQWSDQMNTVGFDVAGNIFAGWHSSTIESPGVAVYDTISQNFNFISEGLPNKNIHKFKINPLLSNATIFTCTDTGVYYCNDYLTNNTEIIATSGQIKIYPNVFNDNGFYVSVNSDAKACNVRLSLYDFSGRLLEQQEEKFDGNSIFIEHFNASDLKQGLYFLVVDIDNASQIFKLVKICARS